MCIVMVNYNRLGCKTLSDNKLAKCYTEYLLDRIIKIESINETEIFLLLSF